jgi:membrane fusion protein (multidrug efflux system)
MNAQSPIVESEIADAASWNRRKRVRGFLMLLAPLVVIIGAIYFYLTGGRYESTENAQLQTGMVAVSASIAGKVASVDVGENQLVKTGQVLFTLGDSSSNAAVAEAEAQVAAARTDVGSMRADYQESLSQINAARAKLTYAQSEVSRQGSLLKEGISSRSQYDAAVLEMRTSRDAIVPAWVEISEGRQTSCPASAKQPRNWRKRGLA